MIPSQQVHSTEYITFTNSNNRGQSICKDQTMPGRVMLSIVHTFPPSLEERPSYVPPPAEEMVAPKVVSASARVILVLMYF